MKEEIKISHRLKKIGSIWFGLLAPDIIRKMSVTQIVTADTYDEDGLPISSGLMDRKLGTIEPGQRCTTCGNRVGECPGHFGHIELSRPVVHVSFAKIIKKLLKSICRRCARLKLKPELIPAYKARMDEVFEKTGQIDQDVADAVLKDAGKPSICPFCEAEQYKVKYEKPTTFYEEKMEGSVRLTPTDIRDRLERIPESDSYLMGIDTRVSRSEWMILVVLPVPPVAVRPSITLESGVKSEDDLTHKLVDVIRINQRLRENIEAGAPQLIVEDLWELLQYHITTYYNNEVSGIPPARHRSGRALRTLAQRLKGKEGRFRSNLSGKRVDFSARTVISPDPNLSINEVGVPLEISKILTVPERVTEWNIEDMRQLVLRGPKEHPGCNYIIRPDGKRIDLRFVKDRKNNADGLDAGHIIERHLRTGDIVLFNRQPSLHRMSIMAHEVKVMPYRTFRLSLCVCPPYNADFDGDEMNLHVPQGEEARAESRILMLVQEQILSPRYGSPIIGGIQDYISSAYLLTRKGTLFTKAETCQLLASAGFRENLPKPSVTKPKPMWTGKQIFSMLLPKGLNLSLKANVCRKCDVCRKEECLYDSFVLIRDGQLLAGVIDKKSFGAAQPNSVLHRIVKDYGNSEARRFLDSMCPLLVTLITNSGFSMGIDDVTLAPAAVRRINHILKEAEERGQELIHAFRAGELQRTPGRSLEETFENLMLELLSNARDGAGEVAGRELGLDKHAVIMTATGAKGSMLNLTQMAACVGQQAVRGKRIYRGYRRRTLPHFKPGDLTPQARGFVKASYSKGLNPVEFFFHAMGGREGLVDTAVRTSTSGYMQRRLINALQDLKVEYDETVRNSEGEIIQFKYGEDGVDPARSDHGKAVNLAAIIERVLSQKR